MTLGEWLNHMIIEGEDERAGAARRLTLRSRLVGCIRAPAPKPPGFSATESLRARLNRELGRDEPAGRDAGPRDIGPRDMGIGHNSEAGELQRIGKMLGEITLGPHRDGSEAPRHPSDDRASTNR